MRRLSRILALAVTLATGALLLAPRAGWCPIAAPPSGQPLTVAAPTTVYSGTPTRRTAPSYPSFGEGGGAAPAPNGMPTGIDATPEPGTTDRTPAASASPGTEPGVPGFPGIPATAPALPAPAPAAPSLPASGPEAPPGPPQTPAQNPGGGPGGAPGSSVAAPQIELTRIPSEPAQSEGRRTGRPGEPTDAAMTTPESLAARVLRTVGVYLGVTLAIMLGMYFQFRRTAKPQKAPPRF